MKDIKIEKNGIKFILMNSNNFDLIDCLFEVLDGKAILDLDGFSCVVYDNDDINIQELSYQLNQDFDKPLYFFEGPRVYNLDNLYTLVNEVRKIDIKKPYYKTNDLLEKEYDFCINNKILFLGKVWDNKEMIEFIKLFLENDLNASMAAKNGYMHRNTINYKLEQIKRETSLDLRHFKDAMTIYKLLF